MSEFSDPAWWPTPPPKPPKAVSTPKLVFGTLLPIVIVGVVIAIFVTQKHHPSKATTGRSLTAFEACMKDQGAETPSVASNARMLQLDAVACKAHLPKGMAVPNYTPADAPPESAREAYQQCMASALASMRGNGSGPFRGGGSRQAFQNAVAFCRGVSQPGGGNGGATT